MKRSRYLTINGFEKAKLELQLLKTEKRKEITRRLQQIERVDGSDYDSEYQSAKEEQAFVEGKIYDLENLLANAILITPGNSDEIAIGNTVIIQQAGFEEETYSIVGTAESNPKERLISDESPLGRSLLGHRRGDEIEVSTPGGVVKLKILDMN